MLIRDWSLIKGKGGGGLQNGSGGRVKIYPYKERGVQWVLAILNGGHTQFRVVFTQ